MIQGSDGNFYGTTYFGGSHGFGTVFKVTPSGTETVLYSFAGGSDGEHPYAGVIQGSDGNFYGTTYQGGASGYGTVFKVTPSGTETVLYSFAGGSSDGANPEAGLTQGSDGNFYGNTSAGGASNLGTVFELTPGGTETILHAFAGGCERWRKSLGKPGPEQRRQSLWIDRRRRHLRRRHVLRGRSAITAVAPPPASITSRPAYTYFGDNVTGTSVMLSTGSLLSSAALRTAASLGPS